MTISIGVKRKRNQRAIRHQATKIVRMLETIRGSQRENLDSALAINGYQGGIPETDAPEI